MDCDKSEMIVFFDETKEVSVLTPWSPRLGNFELAFSDPFPGSTQREYAVSVPHHVHHLVSMLVQNIIYER